MLRVARAGAVKARTQAGNQLRDLIVTAPEALRQQLAGLPRERQVETAARFRPGDLADAADGARAAMASVARRHQQLTAEIARLDAALEELITRAAPKQFLARRTAEGKTTKEIIRCLKRYIAHEIYRALCQTQQPGRASAPQAKQDLSARVLT
jgi:hypothetical protein